MKKLIYGTTNKGKIEFMKNVLSGTSIELVTLEQLNAHNLDSDIVENGRNPEENALKKAMFFYEQLNAPVLAVDSGMYFCDYPMDHKIQPGCYIRRVNGKRLNDLEMKEHYLSLAAEHSGKMAFKYCNGMAIVFSPSEYYTVFDDSTASLHYLYDHKVNEQRDGFPIDEISKVDSNSDLVTGYRDFIVDCLEKYYKE